jgi:hypothetical protein
MVIGRGEEKKEKREGGDKRSNRGSKISKIPPAAPEGTPHLRTAFQLALIYVFSIFSKSTSRTIYKFRFVAMFVRSKKS